MGNLFLFAINPGMSRVMTIVRTAISTMNSRQVSVPGTGYHIVDSKAGFTTVVAVDIGPDGLLYALELSAAAGYPSLGQGKVVRVKHSGEIEDVVTGLNVPGGMTFGPDDRLYISDSRPNRRRPSASVAFCDSTSRRVGNKGPGTPAAAEARSGLGSTLRRG